MTLREAILSQSAKMIAEHFAYEPIYWRHLLPESCFDQLCSVAATYVYQIMHGPIEPSGIVLPLAYSPHTSALTWRVIIPEEAVWDPGKLAECELVMPEIYRQVEKNQPTVQNSIQCSILTVLLSIWDAQNPNP